MLHLVILLLFLLEEAQAHRLLCLSGRKVCVTHRTGQDEGADKVALYITFVLSLFYSFLLFFLIHFPFPTQQQEGRRRRGGARGHRIHLIRYGLDVIEWKSISIAPILSQHDRQPFRLWLCPPVSPGSLSAHSLAHIHLHSHKHKHTHTHTSWAPSNRSVATKSLTMSSSEYLNLISFG